MKYLVVGVAGIFGGFVIAWWLFTSTAPGIQTPTGMTDRPAPAITTSPDERDGADDHRKARPGRWRFDDIAAQSTVFDQLYVAWQLAADADIPALEDMIRRCRKTDDPLYTNSIASVFVERYVEIDPRAAIAFVEAEYPIANVNMRAHVLTSWVRYDPEAAIDYFGDMTDVRYRMAIASRLLADPTLASSGLLADVEEIVGVTTANRIREQRELQQTDPETLFEQAMNMTGAERQRAMSIAISRMASRDPEAALARIEALSNLPDYQFLMQMAIHHYARQDPEAAYNYLQLHMPENTGLQSQVISMIAQRDVNRALTLARDVMRQSGDTSAMQNVISRWAQQDPRQALAYVETLDLDQQQRMLHQVAFAYMQQHPDEAFEWILGMGREHGNLRTSLLRNVNNWNAVAAERWLPRVTDPTARAALIAGIATYKAEADPEAAVDWLSRYREDERAYTDAYRQVLSRLSHRNPRRAATLADAIVDQDGVAPVVANIATNWYSQDPDAALDWIASLRNTDVRNQAVSQISGRVANRDPEAAVELLDALPPGSHRDNAARAIAYAWSVREPDRIDEIVSTLNLPASMAEQLQQNLDRQMPVVRTF